MFSMAKHIQKVCDSDRADYGRYQQMSPADKMRVVKGLCFTMGMISKAGHPDIRAMVEATTQPLSVESKAIIAKMRMQPLS